MFQSCHPSSCRDFGADEPGGVLLLHVFLPEVAVDGGLPTCATVLVSCCCEREAMARDGLRLGGETAVREGT